MVDGENLLHKVIVDDRLIREAHRCREMWHQLQELGGIHNSHAQRLLARERKNWEEARQSEVRAPAAAVEAAAAAAAPAAAPVAPAGAEKERPSDEPYIETPRCSSCDECTQINNRMFAYDANKQARIIDPSAGTYRQLVEAAESCQVAIIHPGKPKNADEPGLEELLKRAEPFL
jgi:ferredoxin